MLAQSPHPPWPTGCYSLRYRLAKVEDILGVSLREPAALSSLFLALAALEHDGVAPAVPSGVGRRQTPADVDAPYAFQSFADPSADRLGVVYGPERD